MKKRKILYVTATRADFELIKSALKKIEMSSKLKLIIVVTGMHLLKSRGYTLKDVEKEFKVSTIVPIIKEGIDSNDEMANATGRCIIGITSVLNKFKPDIILIEGDRIEGLATGIAGAMLNIPIAHISGGDVTKSIDDSIRNMLTKLAHIHFPGTQQSAERILKMGEEPWRIHMVRTPINKEILSKEDLEREIGIKITKDTLLLIQHPVSTQSKESKKQMIETMEAIKTINKKTIVIYPNTDAGGEDIIRVIQDYSHLDNIYIFKNLKGRVYMSLLKYADAIIGNSSSGVTEAPYFNTPCVNIGIREEGREQAGNVINIPHDRLMIVQAIRLALSKSFKNKIAKLKNPYNSKNVEENICKVLENIEINPRLINKKMTY